MPAERTAAIIVAGGSGERFGHSAGKQLAIVAGRPVLAWTVEAFGRSPEIDLIVVVCPEARLAEYREALGTPGPGAGPAVTFAPSGPTRQDSVASGLSRLADDISVVVVHDGARPLVTPQLIGAAVGALARDATAAGVVVGHPVVDTVKVVSHGAVLETPDRSSLWAVQTPQVFRRGALVSACDAATRDGFVGTDDSSLLERIDARVVLVEGPRDNVKVTHAEDLALVEQVLARRIEGG